MVSTLTGEEASASCYTLGSCTRTVCLGWINEVELEENPNASSSDLAFKHSVCVKVSPQLQSEFISSIMTEACNVLNSH